MSGWIWDAKRFRITGLLKPIALAHPRTVYIIRVKEYKEAYEIQTYKTSRKNNKVSVKLQLNLSNRVIY